MQDICIQYLDKNLHIPNLKAMTKAIPMNLLKVKVICISIYYHACM